MSNDLTKKDPGVLNARGLLWSLAIGLFFLVVLVIFMLTHWEETKELLVIIGEANGMWVLVAILFQILTYILAGAIWYLIAKSEKHLLSLKSLTYLSIEQTSVNQLIPVGGIAGNVILVRAMKRLGLSNALSVEVLCVDTLAHHISFSFVIFISVIILALENNLTPIIISLISIFFIIEFIITVIIWTIVNHKKLTFLNWLKTMGFVSRILNSIENISSDRVFSIKLLTETSFLKFGIFILGIGTFFVIMKSIGADTDFSVVFVTFVIASVARSITFLPGGLGGFEAGSIATLVLFGTPVGIAIVGTVLLRGLTFWIPLIPGLVLAREDLEFFKTSSAEKTD